MAGRLRIGVLGSCRVKDPLRLSGAKVKISPSIGHIHNPLEILQALDLISGQPPPPDLLDLLNIHSPERLATPLDVDVFVVEVSSIRILQHRGWQLQIHCFREMLKGEDVPAEDIKILYEDMDRWKKGVDRLASSVSPRTADILRGAQHWEMSLAQIVDSLDAIAARLAAPVLFVGPIVEAFGKRPPQRVRLRDALNAWSSRTGEPVFDPTPLVADEDLIDLGHYRPEAQARIGEALQQAARSLLDRHRPPAGPKAAVG